MTEDEQVAQRIVDGTRYQIQVGTVDANWSLIEQQQWISLESLKVAIVAALRTQREAPTKVYVVMCADYPSDTHVRGVYSTSGKAQQGVVEGNAAMSTERLREPPAGYCWIDEYELDGEP